MIVDQFIASAEEKWRQLSGVTLLLLPHGFEGMGPEHSSARIERFLLLAANDNMQCVSPSTPAQYFHMLCRQVMRPWRKPLIVMTPKSLLRHPSVVSDIGAFTKGKFQRVIADDDVNADDVKRVLLCSGKIYYELLQKRTELHRTDIAIGAHRTVLSVLRQSVERGAAALRRRHAGHLGAGRTGEHGRVALSETALRRQSVRALPILRRLAARVGEPGDRLRAHPPLRTTTLIHEALTEVRERTEAVH